MDEKMKKRQDRITIEYGKTKNGRFFMKYWRNKQAYIALVNHKKLLEKKRTLVECEFELDAGIIYLIKVDEKSTAKLQGKEDIVIDFSKVKK